MLWINLFMNGSGSLGCFSLQAGLDAQSGEIALQVDASNSDGYSVDVGGIEYAPLAVNNDSEASSLANPFKFGN
jgi:hypothetical protein